MDRCVRRKAVISTSPRDGESRSRSGFLDSGGGSHRADPRLNHGTLIDTITDPSFDVATTLAGFGRRVYVVNACFTTEPGPEVTYDIRQLPRY